MSLDAEDDKTLAYTFDFVTYRKSTEQILKSFELGLYPIYKKYGFTFQQAFTAYQAEQQNQWLKDIANITQDSDEEWKND